MLNLANFVQPVVSADSRPSRGCRSGDCAACQHLRWQTKPRKSSMGTPNSGGGP
uniref:U1764x n=1 Tax=Mycobacterium leprae TaxID=1769 RepID=Q50007_MYCLR|nr:u1764x [Mycobacterium leprae]